MYLCLWIGKKLYPHLRWNLTFLMTVLLTCLRNIPSLSIAQKHTHSVGYIFIHFSLVSLIGILQWMSASAATTMWKVRDLKNLKDSLKAFDLFNRLTYNFLILNFHTKFILSGVVFVWVCKKAYAKMYLCLHE